jgi:hypothetical protein
VYVKDFQFGSESASIDPIVTIDPSYLAQGYGLIESPGIGNLPDTPTVPTATPEPGTMLLMGLGMAGAAWMRSRKMRNA